MIQCPETHLFCVTCMTTYASNLLGAHDPNIICMDQSGCTLPFSESELHRFLTPKLLALYERVKQRKEIEAAGEGEDDSSIMPRSRMMLDSQCSFVMFRSLRVKPKSNKGGTTHQTVHVNLER